MIDDRRSSSEDKSRCSSFEFRYVLLSSNFPSKIIMMWSRMIEKKKELLLTKKDEISLYIYLEFRVGEDNRKKEKKRKYILRFENVINRPSELGRSNIICIRKPRQNPNFLRDAINQQNRSTTALSPSHRNISESIGNYSKSHTQIHTHTQISFPPRLHSRHHSKINI